MRLEQHIAVARVTAGKSVDDFIGRYNFQY